MGEIIELYKKFWTNGLNFNGRTSRKDFWLTFVANILVSFVVGFVAGLLGKIGLLISGLYGLAIIIPTFALEIRRLHDINKSGWFLLISLIPAVGSIILIVLYCLDSVNENNRYGSQV